MKKNNGKTFSAAVIVSMVSLYLYTIFAFNLGDLSETICTIFKIIGLVGWTVSTTWMRGSYNNLLTRIDELEEEIY